MKTTVVKPTAAIAMLSLTWSIATALPATGQTRTDLSRTAPSALALGSVPRPYLAWYQGAAQTCPGLRWPVLAGIGEVESDHGQSPLPGVHSASNFAGAEGPMQFEPRTFAAFAVKADPRRALSVYNPEDAIYTAARMLCDDGAEGGTPQGIDTALYAYNHAQWYMRDVLSWASRYAGARAARVVIHTPAPAPPKHTHHSRPVLRTEYAHPAPAAARPARRAHTVAASQVMFGNEAEQLAAEAGQLASEASLLSGEARQLTTEARQLSGDPQLPLPAEQPSSDGQPSSAGQQPPAPPAAPAPPAPPAPVATTPAGTVPSVPATSSSAAVSVPVKSGAPREVTSAPATPAATPLVTPPQPAQSPAAAPGLSATVPPAS